jgi:MYXO-CTERM domain-containing protein
MKTTLGRLAFVAATLVAAEAGAQPEAGAEKMGPGQGAFQVGAMASAAEVASATGCNTAPEPRGAHGIFALALAALAFRLLRPKYRG